MWTTLRAPAELWAGSLSFSGMCNLPRKSFAPGQNLLHQRLCSIYRKKQVGWYGWHSDASSPFTGRKGLRGVHLRYILLRKTIFIIRPNFWINNFPTMHKIFLVEKFKSKNKLHKHCNPPTKPIFFYFLKYLLVEYSTDSLILCLPFFTEIQGRNGSWRLIWKLLISWEAGVA